MDQLRRNALKARLGFNQWKEAARRSSAEQLFVYNYRMREGDLPGWRLMRSRRVPIRPGVQLKSYTFAPAYAGAAAASARGPEAPRLVVDAVEHPDADAAQEALIDLAIEFHLPVPLEARFGDIGEVHLATPNGFWLAFVRGNLLIRLTWNEPGPSVTPLQAAALTWAGLGAMASAPVAAMHVDQAPGPGPSLAAVARQLDLALMSKPTGAEASPTTVRLQADTAAAMAPAGPQEFQLPIDAPDDADGWESAPTVKIFSRGGMIRREGGLRFQPSDEDVTVEAVIEPADGPPVYQRYDISSDGQPPQPGRRKRRTR